MAVGRANIGERADRHQSRAAGIVQPLKDGLQLQPVVLARALDFFQSPAGRHPAVEAISDFCGKAMIDAQRPSCAARHQRFPGPFVRDEGRRSAAAVFR